MADAERAFTFTVEAGDRLDKFLATHLAEFSRSRLQGLIHDGFISVDGVVPAKAGTHIKPGLNVMVGKDDTLFATADGLVMYDIVRGRKRVNIVPKAE